LFDPGYYFVRESRGPENSATADVYAQATVRKDARAEFREFFSDSIAPCSRDASCRKTNVLASVDTVLHGLEIGWRKAAMSAKSKEGPIDVSDEGLLFCSTSS
jgi:hypothetical protein